MAGGGEPDGELVGHGVDRDEVHRRILLGAHEIGGDDGDRHGEPV